MKLAFVPDTIVCESGCVVITGGFAVNVAVIDLLLSSVMVEGLVVPVRSPLHPENCHPGAGTAVRVDLVPAGCGVPGGFAGVATDPTEAEASAETVWVND